jgi:hypothetical protein
MNIKACNVSQMLGESSRFLFHVFLVHISTCVVEGKKEFFSEELFRTLLITALAIMLYHVFFRKIMEPKIEKMKLICYKGIDRDQKKKDIQKEYFPIDEQSQTRNQDQGHSHSHSRDQDQSRYQGKDQNRDEDKNGNQNQDRKRNQRQRQRQDQDQDQDRYRSQNQNRHQTKRKENRGDNNESPRSYSERQQIFPDRTDRQ